MDRLKEQLKTMPHPPVPQFQQTLRHDLQAAMRPAPQRGMKLALAGTSALALVLATLVVAFVARPDLPRQIHTAWLAPGQGMTGSAIQAGQPAPGTEELRQQAVLRRFLEEANADVGEDQAYLETWYSDQARPARVKAMRQERLLAIRQFELASGERVAVLTDLGAAAQGNPARVVPAAASGRSAGRTY